jgi:hypothetical protein
LLEFIIGNHKHGPGLGAARVPATAAADRTGRSQTRSRVRLEETAPWLKVGTKMAFLHLCSAFMRSIAPICNGRIAPIFSSPRRIAEPGGKKFFRACLA